jgi:hypothetical protein
MEAIETSTFSPDFACVNSCLKLNKLSAAVFNQPAPDPSLPTKLSKDTEVKACTLAVSALAIFRLCYDRSYRRSWSHYSQRDSRTQPVGKHLFGMTCDSCRLQSPIAHDHRSIRVDDLSSRPICTQAFAIAIWRSSRNEWSDRIWRR